MDKENRSLIRGLFAVSTMLLEDAIGPATDGQSPRRTTKEYKCYLTRLAAAANNILSLMQGVNAVLEFDAQLAGHRRSAGNHRIIRQKHELKAG